MTIHEVDSRKNSSSICYLLLLSVVYSAVIIIIAVLLLQIFTLFRAFLFAYGGICAAKVLHCRLLRNILSAPVSFFDVSPVRVTYFCLGHITAILSRKVMRH